MATQNKGTGFDHEAASPPRGKNYLLVIAIDEYVHCPKLNNCVKDAREFIEVLTGKYQFEPGHVTTLYNDQATRANILSRLNELKRKVGSEDNLIIYFSGHGETEDDVGYWVPVAASPEHNWEFISTYDIKSRLDPIPSFHTFVIVDACFSGSLFTSYKTVKAGYDTKRSRLGLAASHSRERALDGTAGDNSPFAAKLLKRLRESPEDLGVQRLATDVIEEVQAATRGRQTPVFKTLDVKGDDSGQYVFHLKANEAADWKACQDAGTLTAYQAFLAKYPEGIYTQAARAMLVELEEEAGWEAAKATNTILSYYRYNQNYLSGKYRAEALTAIKRLEEEQAWRQAKRAGSLSAFLEYKERYPQGRFTAEAEEQIQAILARQQEPAAWQAAKGKDTSVAYEAYLQEYPQGAHALEAQAAIQQLKKKAKEAERRKEDKIIPKQQIKQKSDAVGTQPRSTQARPMHQVFSQPKSAFDWKKWGPVGAGVLVVLLVVWGTSQWAGGGSIPSGTPSENTAITQKNTQQGEETGGESPSTQTSTVSFGGQTYKTIRLNGKTWIAQNLNIDVPESWCYEGKSANCQKYGRLYTWQTAQDACKKLGGRWRLPTDAEWSALRAKYGGEKGAYKALIERGSTDFAALLGGYRGLDGSFSYLGLSGGYWSGTEKGPQYAWDYSFGSVNGELYRLSSRKSLGLSCRCMKD